MTKLILNSKIFFLIKILIISIIFIISSHAEENNYDQNTISIGSTLSKLASFVC